MKVDLTPDIDAEPIMLGAASPGQSVVDYAGDVWLVLDRDSGFLTPRPDHPEYTVPLARRRDGHFAWAPPDQPYTRVRAVIALC